MTPLDAAWLRANPLPAVEDGTDKNDRGRVLVAGGSTTCPGALRLTAEAALRAGAGKVQMATVADAALMLGMAVPEGAVFPLPANDAGELAEAAGARRAAGRFDAVVALKGGETIVAAPDGRLLSYPGGGVGLATGGSGDVLAGIIGGLLARGVPPFEATAWGVWLHGEAGRRLAERDGTIGFLARELPALIPKLMR